MARSSPSRDETSSEAIKVSIGPRDRVTRAKYKRERERERVGVEKFAKTSSHFPLRGVSKRGEIGEPIGK